MNNLFSSLLAVGLMISVAGPADAGKTCANNQQKAGFATPPVKVHLRLATPQENHQPTANLPKKAEALAVATLRSISPEDETIRGDIFLRLTADGGKPARTLRHEVTLQWVRGTACPTLRLQVPLIKGSLIDESAPEAPREMVIIQPFVIRVEETAENLSQMLCSWTRQINAGRPRRGVISAINRALDPR